MFTLVGQTYLKWKRVKITSRHFGGKRCMLFSGKIVRYPSIYWRMQYQLKSTVCSVISVSKEGLFELLIAHQIRCFQIDCTATLYLDEFFPRIPCSVCIIPPWLYCSLTCWQWCLYGSCLQKYKNILILRCQTVTSVLTIKMFFSKGWGIFKRSV